MVDYKKLLKRCLQEWYNSEGCCWCPDVADREFDEGWEESLSDEDISAANEIFEEVRKEYEDHIGR